MKLYFQHLSVLFPNAYIFDSGTWTDICKEFNRLHVSKHGYKFIRNSFSLGGFVSEEGVGGGWEGEGRKYIGYSIVLSSALLYILLLGGQNLVELSLLLGYMCVYIYMYPSICLPGKRHILWLNHFSSLRNFPNFQENQ